MTLLVSCKSRCSVTSSDMLVCHDSTTNCYRVMITRVALFKEQGFQTGANLAQPHYGSVTRANQKPSDVLKCLADAGHLLALIL